MNAPVSDGRRTGVMVGLLAVVALIGAAAAFWYYSIGQWRETTEDAYVGGNLALVSPQIDGTVVWISGELNEYVQAGRVLIRLRENEPRNELEQRKQELALAVKEISALRERVRRYESEIAQWNAVYLQARGEYDRRVRLAKAKMVSEEELKEALAKHDESFSALETARRKLDEYSLRAGAMPIPEHPLVQRAIARLGRAYAVWQKRTILAPVSGHIAKRNVQPGQRVKSGDALMAISQLDSLWVDANFKETQLRHIHLGQKVHISSDLYGKDVPFDGRVAGIGSGTGAVFSLLPPQNATGNWIKIVQRVPVRIAITREALQNNPLPLGSSMRVSVDTTDRSGARLATLSPPRSVDETRVYEVFTDGFDELVDSIIASNLPNAASPLASGP
jgi:membrane fusion protein, multidrug efflux system